MHTNISPCYKIAYHITMLCAGCYVQDVMCRMLCAGCFLSLHKPHVIFINCHYFITSEHDDTISLITRTYGYIPVSFFELRFQPSYSISSTNSFTLQHIQMIDHYINVKSHLLVECYKYITSTEN